MLAHNADVGQRHRGELRSNVGDCDVPRGLYLSRPLKLPRGPPDVVAVGTANYFPLRQVVADLDKSDADDRPRLLDLLAVARSRVGLEDCKDRCQVRK